MQSNYPPDPGGVFASDYHRRVAAHLPLPGTETITVADLLERVVADAYNGIGDNDDEALRRILDDLSEAGYAKYLDGTAGWRLLKAGLDALSGPALTMLAEVDGEVQRVEPPPMGGAPLVEAEAQQQRIAKEDDAIEKAAIDAAVSDARNQLEAAEAAQEEVA